MKVDGLTLVPEPATVASEAAAAEARGYDGWFTAETAHDPFLTVALAAAATERVEIGTAIAVAFARSPMDVAYSANDLQVLSGGRFVLGLGSQIAPHIRRRFSMPWSRPAARMREYVLALRAIWDAWATDERLRFEGEFYEHTLMTPFFSPGESPHGPPPVYLAAVGPLMTRVAGEVADGLLCHSFTTDRYLREVTLPALAAGAEEAGRALDDVTVNLGVFVVSGYDDEQRAAADRFVRSQIAFYGSTPAYLPVLELHGWEELHTELNALSRRGAWDEMADLVDDEVLEAFAVVGEPDELADRIVERYGDVVARTSLYTSFDFRDDDWAAFLETLRSTEPRTGGQAPGCMYG